MVAAPSQRFPHGPPLSSLPGIHRRRAGDEDEDAGGEQQLRSVPLYLSFFFFYCFPFRVSIRVMWEGWGRRSWGSGGGSFLACSPRTSSMAFPFQVYLIIIIIVILIRSFLLFFFFPFFNADLFDRVVE